MNALDRSDFRWHRMSESRHSSRMYNLEHKNELRMKYKDDPVDYK